MDIWTDGQLDLQMDGWMDGWTDGQMERKDKSAYRDTWTHLKNKKITEINFFSKLWSLFSTFAQHNCPEN